MKKPIIKYEREKCECCGQTTTYASKINKGMCDYLIALANAVRISGKNSLKVKELIVDPREPRWSDRNVRRNEGKIIQSQYDNRSHLRAHGFIARIGANTYCLTKKGAAFLRGEPAGAAAIIEKRTHSNIGYIADADGAIIMTTIKEVFRNQDGYWDGWNYEIVNGELIHKDSIALEQGSLL